MIKNKIKQILLKRKNIFIDSKTLINYSVKNSSLKGKPIKIINSNIHLMEVGEGVFIENVVGYGNIFLERFTSISGPGTVLHSVENNIKIGAFSSIAQNVSIQEFNHDQRKPSTYAMNYNMYNEKFKNDVVSKGDIIIEEDVWVGSNVVILSGVNIGRGSIVGAGSLVTKNIPKYSIVFGNPAKIYKKRFSEDIIELLEDIQWWNWSIEKIEKNKEFFNLDLNYCSLDYIRNLIV